MCTAHFGTTQPFFFVEMSQPAGEPLHLPNAALRALPFALDSGPASAPKFQAVDLLPDAGFYIAPKKQQRCPTAGVKHGA